ncbi:hypothetical protein TI04_00305 [Achromatium sp. WMS2]|nr:hypothetical protein TI04_00305 [Achromatium sp. WMS2]
MVKASDDPVAFVTEAISKFLGRQGKDMVTVKQAIACSKRIPQILEVTPKVDPQQFLAERLGRMLGSDLRIIFPEGAKTAYVARNMPDSETIMNIVKSKPGSKTINQLAQNLPYTKDYLIQIVNELLAAGKLSVNYPNSKSKFSAPKLCLGIAELTQTAAEMGTAPEVVLPTVAEHVEEDVVSQESAVTPEAVDSDPEYEADPEVAVMPEEVVVPEAPVAFSMPEPAPAPEPTVEPVAQSSLEAMSAEVAPTPPAETRRSRTRGGQSQERKRRTTSTSNKPAANTDPRHQEATQEVANVSAVTSADEAAFKEAYKKTQGRFGGVLISKLRKFLGWEAARFDAVLDSVRSKGYIDVNVGDITSLDREDIDNGYTDWRGRNYINLTWRSQAL